MALWGFECTHCGASSSEYTRSDTRPDKAAPLCKCGYGMVPFLAAEPTGKPPSLRTSNAGLPRATKGRRTVQKFPAPGRWSAKDRSIMRNGRRLK